MELLILNRYMQRYRNKLLDVRSRFIGEITAEEVRIQDHSDPEKSKLFLDRYFLLREDLELVEDALGRIVKQTFGRCHHCGAQIEAERLSAMPWARWCSMCRGLGGGASDTFQRAVRVGTREKPSAKAKKPSGQVQ